MPQTGLYAVFWRGRVKDTAPSAFEAGKPLKSRIFRPLNGNIGKSYLWKGNSVDILA